MRFLPRTCRAIDRHCSAASVILGKGVAWLTALMAIVTTLIVFLRAFSVGAVALQESVTYMHALVLMCAAAYTLRADGHVRVDIFYRSYSPLSKAWVDSIGTVLFLLPFCVYCCAVSWNYVGNSWAIREASPDAGGIPAIYLMKSLILVYGATLALQGVAELARKLITLLYVTDHE